MSFLCLIIFRRRTQQSAWWLAFSGWVELWTGTGNHCCKFQFTHSKTIFWKKSLFSLTPVTLTRVKLQPGPTAKSVPQLSSEFSFLGHPIMSVCDVVRFQSARSMKRHCMILKLMLESLLNWTRRKSSNGWTWKLMKMNTALKCTCHTSQRLWKISRTSSQLFPC